MVARSQTKHGHGESRHERAHTTVRGSRTDQRHEPQVAEQALPELDPLVHERMRLGILSALAVNRSLSFNELKRLLNTTDGNLSVHARKLEEAHYVECSKFFEGRMPKTEYKLTGSGRKALEQYLDRMEAFIHSTRQG